MEDTYFEALYQLLHMLIDDTQTESPKRYTEYYDRLEGLREAYYASQEEGKE